MSFEHFSHEHPLILRNEVDTTDGGDEMLCYACHNPIIQSSAVVAAAADGDVYICSDVTCNDAFYLHKKCAELPKEIQHPMHVPHPLTLHSRPPGMFNWCTCNVCGRSWEWFTYHCKSCQFRLCIICAVGDRSFRHVGHGQHTLTLMQREALFMCDACGTEAKDSSYACNSCGFWMHKSCALSKTMLEADFIHHHPLVLTYSIPDIHRTFGQYCRICKYMMDPSRWLYYCDKCTYFAHIKCIATARTSGEKEKSEAEPQEDVDEHDLVTLPVLSKESFIHLITDQFAKGNFNIIELQKDMAAPDCYPQTLNNHWSHKDHPLILLEELVQSNNDQVEIICNVCIQPITPAVEHPFYGCIECNFFLHKFCLQLPGKLPAGVCSRHPQHPLVLFQLGNKFDWLRCAACRIVTNGFMYGCERCDTEFDIRCCFLPNRIKHQSHNHPLLHDFEHPYGPGCRACDSHFMVMNYLNAKGGVAISRFIEVVLYFRPQ